MLARILAVLVVLALSACKNTSSAPPPEAVTETDLASDPNLRLEPGQVGVTFLEPIDAADASAPDTGTVGVDVIPFLVSEAGTYTYALDPDDTSGTIARAEVSDAGSGFHIHGLLRATLMPSSPTATVTLDAGQYDLVIYSGYTSSQESGSHRAVFLRPSGRTATDVPAGSGRSRSADQLDVRRPTSTNACPGCDLYGLRPGVHRDLQVVRPPREGAPKAGTRNRDARSATG